MFKELFVAPHEWLDRTVTAAGEYAKLEEKGREHASSMVDEWSKLTKESWAYTTELASAWRKLTLDALKKSIPQAD